MTGAIDDERYKPTAEKGPEEYTDITSAWGQAIDARSDAAKKLDPMAMFLMKANVKKSGVEKEFSTAGLRQFALLAGGSTGAVIDTTEDQIIRLERVNTDDAKAPRLKSVMLIQPIPPYRVDGNIASESLVKLNTQMSREDALKFAEHLEENGYKLGDFNPAFISEMKGDAGYMRDGTPIVIDKGGLDMASSEEREGHTVSSEWIEKHKQWLSPKVDDDHESIFPWLHGTGYISKQERLYPAIADGRIRGVLSDADLALLSVENEVERNQNFEKLREIKPECFCGAEGSINNRNLEEFVALVGEQGLYPSQARQVLDKEHRLGPVPSDVNLSGVVHITPEGKSNQTSIVPGP